MNKQALRLWVDALRSGEYSQTTGILGGYTDSGDARYCCLGVACMVAEKAGVPIKIRIGDSHLDAGPDITDTLRFLNLRNEAEIQGFRESGLDGVQELAWSAGVLPVQVADWLFGQACQPGDSGNVYLKVNDLGDMDLASELNDRQHWTFEQIADAIENTFLKEES